MYSLLWLGFWSFVLSFLLTPLCRNLFRRLGLVDSPDGDRKLHAAPIPRLGGIPIVLACFAGFGMLLLSPLQGGIVLEEHVWLFWRLLPAAGLIFAIGVADDLWDLKPWQKLLGELAAAVLAYGAGVQIQMIGYHYVEGWWVLPLTILWLLACTNAFNLIDGIDGLASGVGLFATLTVLIVALIQQNFALALVVVPLAGALLGFLRYNFNPASIFLGDSGSLTIGFLLGCFGVIWSTKSATLLGMTAPLMTLAIPLLDTSLSIVRRFLRRQPIFTADRGHIHHRLLARGWTPRRVALLLYGLCGLGAAFSVLQTVLRNNESAMLVILVFCAITWLGVQHLGYVEFGTASRLVLSGAFRRTLHGQLILHSFEDALQKAETVDDFAAAVREACRQLGFASVRLSLFDTLYQDQISESDPDHCWQLRVPLNGTRYINFTREFNSPVLPMAVAPFVDALERGLRAKFGLQETGNGFSDCKAQGELWPQAEAPPVLGGSLRMVNGRRSSG
jgi:UDP-GlcNAc:undecaprenyl-phosphate GlcNAc-1-phosphate transferase